MHKCSFHATNVLLEMSFLVANRRSCLGIAINGFGRIGRLVIRALIENSLKNKEFACDIVAINDWTGIAVVFLQFPCE